ncbi:hypothetical protein, partial [Paraburkholderia hospita]|uniref:hypothetical protein n=1 Tax=Paraburkholderia hospita TaxID=169430 RepID=UPI001A990F6C
KHTARLKPDASKKANTPPGSNRMPAQRLKHRLATPAPGRLNRKYQPKPKSKAVANQKTTSHRVNYKKCTPFRLCASVP